jgi:hypothetical protein
MRVTGKWSTSRFATTVARFGYNSGDDGFLYGNITITGQDYTYNTATIVFVNGNYYNGKTELYQGVQGRTRNCSTMMKPLVEVSLMPVKNCTKPHLKNPKDFLRSVPCAQDELCPSPDWNVTGPVVPGSQLTFRVATSSPKDWFALLLGCSISPVQANSTKNDTWKPCVWKRLPNTIAVEYDLWLVNGDPSGSRNFFIFQFSFELQGVLQMAIVFLALFVGLGAIHLFGVLILKAPGHTLIRLYTASLFSESLGITFHFIHYMIYAKNGVGIVSLRDLGDFCVIVTQCLFMLLLLLIAKGWTITTVYLTNKKYVAGLWITYVILNIVLFIVNIVTSLNEFSGRSAYQSIPGGFILALRCLILIWFLYELRNSYLQENVPGNLNLYRFFGLFYTCWFLYLPIAVGIMSDISVLYQYKVIYGTLHSADFLSLAVMAWLLWPSRSKSYFRLTGLDSRRLLEPMVIDTI